MSSLNSKSIQNCRIRNTQSEDGRDCAKGASRISTHETAAEGARFVFPEWTPSVARMYQPSFTANTPDVHREPLKMTKLPERPWRKTRLDF